MPGSITPIERMMRRDRALIAASLAAVTAPAWFYLLAHAAHIADGGIGTAGLRDMSAASGGGAMMAVGPMLWTPATFALMFAMWWVMMLGMMVPGAAPMILLFARVHRHRLGDPDPLLPTALFASGYLLVWSMFSAVATLLQWGLSEAAMLSPAMASASPLFGAAVLIAAGAYQLTALKRACLVRCRSPVEFLAEHWKAGRLGAVGMGVTHGTYCVGCCWALMALLFVGGVMNLLWVAAIAAFVLAEKLAPRGEWIARASGVAMLGTGVYVAARGFGGG